jgi:hypothetical protein
MAHPLTVLSLFATLVVLGIETSQTAITDGDTRNELLGRCPMHRAVLCSGMNGIDKAIPSIGTQFDLG